MELRDYYHRNKMPEYKSQRNRVTEQVRDAKRDYFNSLLQYERDTKHIWRAINVITNKKANRQNIIPLAPDELNSYFLTNPPNLANSKYGEYNGNFDIPKLLKDFYNNVALLTKMRHYIKVRSNQKLIQINVQLQ